MSSSSGIESSTHKKVGLAKLAKARSISNEINQLGLESPQDEKGDDAKAASPKGQTDSNNTQKKEPLAHVCSEGNIYGRKVEPISSLYIRKVSREEKMNGPSKPDEEEEEDEEERVSDPTSKSPDSEVSLSSSPNSSNKAKEEKDVETSKKSFLQNLNRKSFRKKKTPKDETDSPSSSDSQLRVPKTVFRSRSLSRLSDAFSHVQNVCITPTNSAAKNSKASHRIGRPASSYTLDQASYDDGSSEEYDDSQSQGSDVSDDLSSRRWCSLGQLSTDSVPLGHVRPSQVRQKNYLFGGLGSLLGTTELERYFPDRNVVIFIATWNMNGKEPPASLDDFLLPDDMDHMPDMYVIGTQESGGDRTEWEVRLQTTIGPSHVLFHSAVLGILHLTVFLRRDLVWFCSVPEDACHSLRPGTYFKTKGAIAISFQFFGTKILFVNTHLFAHEEKLPQRIQNYKAIIHNLDLPRNLKGMKMNKPKDVTSRYDVAFWLGDLNFRLVGPRDQILDKIEECSVNGTDLGDLLWFDQLTQTRKKGEIFQGFSEGCIDFAPTFKFDVGTNHYDSSSKQRVPSYTDRILYKSTRDPIKCSSYRSCPLFKTSDHKPVWGVFQFKVRPGKDDIPLAAGLFQRDVYLTALKRRRRFFHQASSKNCQMQ